jgi:hypothetical protein
MGREVQDSMFVEGIVSDFLLIDKEYMDQQ